MSQSGGVSPRIAALKWGTRAAIEAAGGLEFCEGETRAKRSQLSRCQSRGHDDTVSIADAVTLDALALTRGGPFILRAMARQLGCALMLLPDVDADETGVARSFLAVTVEMGDLAREVDDALRDGVFEADEAQRVLVEIDALVEQTLSFRRMVEGFAWPAAAERTA